MGTLNSPTARVLTATVLVVTYNRADNLRVCLEHIQHQSVLPAQVIVVDASPDDATYRLVTEHFPDVEYLRNPLGAGSTATSRSIGLSAATGDVLAMLDDDAYAEPDWLERLLEPYADQSVGGVGGRAANGHPGEEHQGTGEIGMLLPNGTLTGNFAADPGRVVVVDHLLGANMSFRRAVLLSIGGIQDFYPGTCLREESDIALRVGAAGWTLLFAPQAVVRHVAGPYAKGRRFDRRYVYFGHRNHIVLLSRTVGRRSPEFRSYVRFGTREAALEVVRPVRWARREGTGLTSIVRAAAGGTLRAAAVVGGLGVGLQASYAATRAPRRPEDQVGVPANPLPQDAPA